jgi:hypothetical protein
MRPEAGEHSRDEQGSAARRPFLGRCSPPRARPGRRSASGDTLRRERESRCWRLTASRRRPDAKRSSATPQPAVIWALAPGWATRRRATRAGQRRMRQLAARPGAGRTTLRGAIVGDERVEMCAPWRGPVLASVSHSAGRRGGGERARQASRAGRASAALTARAARHRRPVTSTWSVTRDGSRTALRPVRAGPGRRHPHAGRRSAKRTHRRTRCLSAGDNRARARRSSARRTPPGGHRDSDASTSSR